jgi:hypothetical protein
MQGNDGTKHWPRFVEEINLLDNLRNENFWTTFPEFAELR